MRESKKGFLIGGLVAGFTAFATVFGFVTDLFDWKKDDTTEVVQTTEETTMITELTTEQIEEVTITTIEEITEPTETEPPITNTEQTTTTTEEVTTEENTMPVNPESLYLCNITPTESSCIYNSDSETDTIGNQYVGNVQYIQKNGYVIYYVGGKYTKLTGIIAADTSCFDNRNVSTITILVDDTAVYSTGEFSRVSTPMEVDIDITGAQWVKIQHSETWYEGRTILADFKFVE